MVGKELYESCKGANDVSLGIKEIRCKNCNKIIAKTNDIARINQYAVGAISKWPDKGCIIQIKCPHRIKNIEGKQEDCNTLNNIEF
jgi:hypothetical protein